MNRSRSFIHLGILLLVSLSVSAQAPQDGVITINGGKDTVLMKPWSTTITPPEPLSPKLVTIYSNLDGQKRVQRWRREWNRGSGRGPVVLGTDRQCFPG